MDTPAQTAYNNIKNLENSGKIPAPTASTTINVGTFDAKTGAFTFSDEVLNENVTWEMPIIYLPDGKPEPPRSETVRIGYINVFTADLLLSFTVANAETTFTASCGAITASTSPNVFPFPIINDRTEPMATPAAAPAPAADEKLAGVGLIKPLPIVFQHSNTVTLDFGNFVTPAVPPGPSKTLIPAGTTTISLSCGSVGAAVYLQIKNFPLMTAGAFTLPALPVAIVYAPPPGPQNKNFSEYSATTSFSNKISTSITRSNTTKSADAYSTLDYITKIASIVSDVASIVEAASAGGSSGGGGGGSGSGSGSGSSAKALGPAINLALDLISGFLSDTSLSTSTVTTDQSTQDMVVTDTLTDTFPSSVGGPGLGDRFIYLTNVMVTWVIISGTMSFTVIGYDGIGAVAAEDLLSDLANPQVASGTIVGPESKFDLATIQQLLSLDPFVNNPNPTLPSPRFVVNDPASISGTSSGQTEGDTLSSAHDVSQTDTTTQTHTTTQVTDYKPGWIVALFEGTQSTDDQSSLTLSYSVQNTVDHKVTSTVHFFGPEGDPYAIGLYYDRMFGTLAFTPAS